MFAIRKKVKMTDKPKRPMSAYMLWLNNAREQIKADNPGIKVTEIAKKGGEIWKSMKDKSEWEEKAAQAKEQYTKYLESCNANGGGGEGGGGKKAQKQGKNAPAPAAGTPDHLDALEARATPSPQRDPVAERDRLIDHLQNELKRMRSEASQMVQERNTMREHCARLESQLRAAQNEVEQERQKAEIVIAQTPEIKQKLAETKEKAKLTDEKFQKLKGAYTQLREEHITLIRQKAEADKLSASLRAAAAQHETAKTALQQQLNDRMKDVELLQRSASSSEEIEAYKSELVNLRSELEHSRQKEMELETIRASLEALEIENKTAKTEAQEKLTTLANELKETEQKV